MSPESGITQSRSTKASYIADRTLLIQVGVAKSLLVQPDLMWLTKPLCFSGTANCTMRGKFAPPEGTPLDSLLNGNHMKSRRSINIVDVSRLESGSHGRRNLVVSLIGRNLFRARSDARLREEFGLAGSLPRIWMALDEAHQFIPDSGRSLAKPQLIRWAKEGRQPGLSLVVATQQPSAIDVEVLSQCDIILSHKLTTRDDVMALNRLSQDYMGSELKQIITNLQRTGQAVLVDDERESVSMLQIRPRQSQHGGGTVASSTQEDYDIWKH